MIATRQMKDQVLTSWGTIQASFPPTPPDEAEISLQWPDSTHEANHPKSSSFKSTPVVAVVGVGYVGAHLVEVFAHHYQVMAFDIDENRLKDVAKQIPNLPIRFTSCAADLSEATHVLISVPTALNQDKAIDTTYLRSAVATVERYIKPGSTIVVESSVAVGMTRQLVGPLMARKGVKVGMSPEVRILSSSLLISI
jgi:UDP-N-acetyl-D-mannosaminuronate dehydrogenase